MKTVAVVTSLSPMATGRYLIEALRATGMRTFVVSDVPDPLADACRPGLVDVAGLLTEFDVHPSFLLFVEGGTMELFPSAMGRVACPTAWYGIDTHMDCEKHVRIGRLFDATFVAQKEYVASLRAEGVRNVSWLPLAFQPSLHPIPEPGRQVDVAYVGSDQVHVNPERHRLLGLLEKRFPSHRFGPATTEEMGRIYAGSRIVFNRSVRNDVNMRCFEAAGAGAVLVTDRLVDNGLEELLEEGRHFVTYTDDDSLVEAVASLLASPSICAEMGRAARLHVLAHHTYANRARTLLASMENVSKGPPPRDVDVFPALLALGLVGGALDAAARALQAVPGGRRPRLAGRLAARWLRIAAAGAGALTARRVRTRR
jgi:hypothetical protein